MSTQTTSSDLTLEPPDNQRLANLCGPLDEHLRLIERRLGVEINNRSNRFKITGESTAVDATCRVLEQLYIAAADEGLTPSHIHLLLQQIGMESEPQARGDVVTEVRTRRGVVRTRGINQQRYLQSIAECDINFGIGPAGTGKTYLAVVAAVEALEQDRVRRLVLTRPAVEAGERLGFLPGDLAQKVDPYLRPLYDALYEMLGFERVAKLMERNVIEVAPLAYMRGRTLNEAFVILDEAQNTTPEQMKMFLTRIGFASTVVITGDITQIDLPRGHRSGLRQVIEVLKGVDGIGFTFFVPKDVVRHPLVQSIVNAYERFERHDKDER